MANRALAEGFFGGFAVLALIGHAWFTALALVGPWLVVHRLCTRGLYVTSDALVLRHVLPGPDVFPWNAIDGFAVVPLEPAHMPRLARFVAPPGNWISPKSFELVLRLVAGGPDVPLLAGNGRIPRRVKERLARRLEAFRAARSSSPT